MPHLVRLSTFAVFTCASLAFAGGCSLIRTPIVDNPELDGGMDAGRDVGMLDVPDGVDTGIDSGIDTGMIDTGMIDTGDRVDTGIDTGVDSGVDAGMRDTGVDTGMPDTGVDSGMPDTGVDAGMPDTGVDAPVRPNCAALYAFLGGEHLDCVETPTTCTIYVNRTGLSELCSDICPMAPGATCANGYRASTFSCTLGTEVGCGDSGNDRICVCNRP